jgi:hypothetical protein
MKKHLGLFSPIFLASAFALPAYGAEQDLAHLSELMNWMTHGAQLSRADGGRTLLNPSGDEYRRIEADLASGLIRYISENQRFPDELLDLVPLLSESPGTRSEGYFARAFALQTIARPDVWAQIQTLAPEKRPLKRLIRIAHKMYSELENGNDYVRYDVRSLSDMYHPLPIPEGSPELFFILVSPVMSADSDKVVTYELQRIEAGHKPDEKVILQ